MNWEEEEKMDWLSHWDEWIEEVTEKSGADVYTYKPVTEDEINDLFGENEQMVLPTIKFVPFQTGTTQKDLIEYMATHGEEPVFLVHLRCKYEHEKQWEYITDACCLCNFDDILWMTDWYEGQQHVEYLGITQIK